MKVINSNHISDQTIDTDICIIGAGPAGMTLARKLCEEKIDVVIAESGGKSAGAKSSELNVMKVESNFRYRNEESNRARQIGGTASLWAGRAVPFTFNPLFDSEWDGISKSVVSYYDDAFRQLNIDPEIQYSHSHSSLELYGYWAFNTQRFKSSWLKNNSGSARIYTNLTFTGAAEFNEERIAKLSFFNHDKKEIRIAAQRFIFAMGGIENTRMLLVMKNQVEKRMGRNYNNVGRYIMDHPRIFHGTLVPNSYTSDLSRYHMNTTASGIYKTGIRNNSTNSRVYCNFKGSPDRITRRVLKIPSKSFQYSSKKLMMRETGVLKTLVNQVKILPLLNRSEYLSDRIDRFVNHQVHNEYKIMTYCEQKPRFHNEVVLDDETDRNNLKVPRLKNSIHPDELAEAVNFYRQLEKLAKKLECKIKYDESYVSNPGNYTDASHIMGGTRYSSDRTKAVVDDKLSLIGIPNLYLAGSSVFPTSGVENPTHLILSLSNYLAGILKNS